MVTGGKLANQIRAHADNRGGPAMEGGVPRPVAAPR
jgi:hypothetical protein